MGEVPIAVVEKGKQPGSHLLSGAVMNPRAIRKLFAGRLALEDIPTYGEVEHEAVYLLTQKRALRIPPPPTMMNHGNTIVSLATLGRFLGEQAEALGAMILPETAGERLCSTTAASSACARATRAAVEKASRLRTSSRAPT